MISDDDLLLYYYRDGLDAGERARIGAALADRPELAQRLHRLVSRLDAAAAIPEVPVPAATMQRWSAALDQAARRQTTAAAPVARRLPMRPQWLAAAAVLLVAIVSVYQFTRQPDSPRIAAATPVATPAAAPSGSAYERGLRTHLASAEQQLASLESATPEERAKLVATIIEQNRVFALAAERAGEPQLARVLRAFSPVLESVGKQGADPAASVAQLSFEFRVMQGRLAASTSPNARSTEL